MLGLIILGFNIMMLKWYKNKSNVTLWQTLSQFGNQFDNHCSNVKLHFTLLNIALRHYKIGF